MVRAVISNPVPASVKSSTYRPPGNDGIDGFEISIALPSGYHADQRLDHPAAPKVRMDHASTAIFTQAQLERLSSRRQRRLISVFDPTASPLVSSKRRSWHLLRKPEDLGPEAAAVVSRVRRDAEAAKAVDLVRQFCRIVRCRCGPQPSGKIRCHSVR